MHLSSRWKTSKKNDNGDFTENRRKRQTQTLAERRRSGVLGSTKLTTVRPPIFYSSNASVSEMSMASQVSQQRKNRWLTPLLLTPLLFESIERHLLVAFAVDERPPSALDCYANADLALTVFGQRQTFRSGRSESASIPAAISTLLPLERRKRAFIRTSVGHDDRGR